MKIFVTDYEGTEHELEAIEGWSAMQVIHEYGLPIKAECGGACACATCHVYVDPAWYGKLPPKRQEEEERLDEAFDLKETSRLSCQIILDEALDGLRLSLAPNPD
ncbi:MAG: 2Fe-2S iron-sulfur cluster binding domain-containing protein [Alphaproteobacteria bacterium]|nr:2Fe-2S iron-sulfur cluster binding domain-containing protein [Alphaproteobacteria bacterium]